MPKTLLALIGALALTAPAAAQQTKLSAVDRDFVMATARDNNYELEAAKLAQTMSTNDAVKTFAGQLITDHTKMGTDLKVAVSAVDPMLELPAAVGDKNQAKLDALRNAGTHFDALFREQMMAGHQDALKAFDEYLKCDQANPGIQVVARQAQPIIRRHKEMAEELPKS